MPDNIDSSILPETGVTDLSILSGMDEDEILVTNDKYLRSLAQIQDVSTVNTQNLAKRKPFEEEKAQLWSEAQNILENHPSVERFRDELAEVEPVERSHQLTETPSVGNVNELNEERIESLLHQWQKDHRIIQFITDEAIHLSQSHPVEVVPTYGLLDELVDDLDMWDGDKYLPEGTLEAARTAVAGLHQHTYPYLEFLIPETYSYRASEIDQVGMLFRLVSTKNTTYRSVTPESGKESQSLNQTSLRAAKENDCILLCSKGNENLCQLGNLLNVKVRQFSID